MLTKTEKAILARCEEAEDVVVQLGKRLGETRRLYEEAYKALCEAEVDRVRLFGLVCDLAECCKKGMPIGEYLERSIEQVLDEHQCIECGERATEAMDDMILCGPCARMISDKIQKAEEAAEQ